VSDAKAPYRAQTATVGALVLTLSSTPRRAILTGGSYALVHALSVPTALRTGWRRPAIGGMPFQAKVCCEQGAGATDYLRAMQAFFRSAELGSFFKTAA
jgi:hypothetical protein